MTSITTKFQVQDGLKTMPAFYEFGKFAIARKRLEDNILVVKYKKSKGPVAGFTNKMSISEPLATLLLDVIDTGTINYELIKDMTQPDRDTFELLIKKADLIRPLKYQKSKTIMSDTELKDRFAVLQGEVAAGNDNASIIREAKELIRLFVAKKMIDKKDANELINDLIN